MKTIEKKTLMAERTLKSGVRTVPCIVSSGVHEVKLLTHVNVLLQQARLRPVSQVI
jgi:hypothetical protein